MVYEEAEANAAGRAGGAAPQLDCFNALVKLDWLESFEQNESVPVSASGYVQFLARVVPGCGAIWFVNPHGGWKLRTGIDILSFCSSIVLLLTLHSR